jgi:hypothetical protein
VSKVVVTSWDINNADETFLGIWESEDAANEFLANEYADFKFHAVVERKTSTFMYSGAESETTVHNLIRMEDSCILFINFYVV